MGILFCVTTGFSVRRWRQNIARKPLTVDRWSGVVRDQRDENITTPTKPLCFGKRISDGDGATKCLFCQRTKHFTVEIFCKHFELAKSEDEEGGRKVLCCVGVNVTWWFDILVCVCTAVLIVAGSGWKERNWLEGDCRWVLVGDVGSTSARYK